MKVPPGPDSGCGRRAQVLHDAASGGSRLPERALKEIDPAWLAHSFAVNTTGPLLVMQAFAPLLRTTDAKGPPRPPAVARPRPGPPALAAPRSLHPRSPPSPGATGGTGGEPLGAGGLDRGQRARGLVQVRR